MFSKVKKILKTRDFKAEFHKLQKQLVKLHKQFPPNPATRMAINQNHSEDQKLIQELAVKYNQEVKELNDKYNKLDREIIIAGMKREIELVKNVNPEQFNLPIINL